MSAASLVKPFNHALGHWQAASVKLQTLAASWRVAEVADRIERLQEEVDAAAARFEDLVREQPEGVANHGRVGDTRRSFRMVLERLAAAKRLIKE